MEMRHMYRLSF
jgi:cytosolic carboxypeptidase protein 2/3